MISAFIYNTPPKNINAIKEPAARNTANSIDSQTLKIPDIMSPPIISRSALTNATHNQQHDITDDDLSIILRQSEFCTDICKCCNKNDNRKFNTISLGAKILIYLARTATNAPAIIAMIPSVMPPP